MSVVMANALGTGIFCGLWQGIGSVLGLATWMGFVGCTSYFSAGCGKTGFIKSMCSNYVGLLWGMCIIMLCICLVLGNILGVCCDYSGRFLAAKFGKDN